MSMFLGLRKTTQQLLSSIGATKISSDEVYGKLKLEYEKEIKNVLVNQKNFEVLVGRLGAFTRSIRVMFNTINCCYFKDPIQINLKEILGVLETLEMDIGSIVISINKGNKERLKSIEKDIKSLKGQFNDVEKAKIPFDQTKHKYKKLKSKLQKAQSTSKEEYDKLFPKANAAHEKHRKNSNKYNACRKILKKNHNKIFDNKKIEYETFVLDVTQKINEISEKIVGNMFKIKPILERLKESSYSKLREKRRVLPIPGEFEDTISYSSIIPGFLYIGSYDGAASYKWLKKEGVKVIVNCSTEVENFFEKYFKYFNIKVCDIESHNIIQFFENFYEIMEENTGPFFVHCVGGISRSSTLVISYLMRKKNIRFYNAYLYVRQRRRIIYPNDGFVKQLLDYEKKIFGNILNDKPKLFLPPGVKIVRIDDEVDGQTVRYEKPENENDEEIKGEDIDEEDSKEKEEEEEEVKEEEDVKVKEKDSKVKEENIESNANELKEEKVEVEKVEKTKVNPSKNKNPTKKKEVRSERQYYRFYPTKPKGATFTSSPDNESKKEIENRIKAPPPPKSKVKNVEKGNVKVFKKKKEVRSQRQFYKYYSKGASLSEVNPEEKVNSIPKKDEKKGKSNVKVRSQRQFYEINSMGANFENKRKQFESTKTKTKTKPKKSTKKTNDKRSALQSKINKYKQSGNVNNGSRHNPFTNFGQTKPKEIVKKENKPKKSFKSKTLDSEDIEKAKKFKTEKKSTKVKKHTPVKSSISVSDMRSKYSGFGNKRTKSSVPSDKRLKIPPIPKTKRENPKKQKEEFEKKFSKFERGNKSSNDNTETSSNSSAFGSKKSVFEKSSSFGSNKKAFEKKIPKNAKSNFGKNKSVFERPKNSPKKSFTKKATKKPLKWPVKRKIIEEEEEEVNDIDAIPRGGSVQKLRNVYSFGNNNKSPFRSEKGEKVMVKEKEEEEKEEEKKINETVQKKKRPKRPPSRPTKKNFNK